MTAKAIRPKNIDPRFTLRTKIRKPLNKPERKRGRASETEQESPSSPPSTLEKRVDMISWGPNNNTTNEIKNQTEGKICAEVTVVIRTLEKPDETTPPPSVTQYNPNTESPCEKNPQLQAKEQYDQNSQATRETNYPTNSKKDRIQTLNQYLSRGQMHYRPALTKKWNFPTHDKGKNESTSFTEVQSFAILSTQSKRTNGGPKATWE